MHGMTGMTPALTHKLEAVLGSRVVETGVLPVGFGLIGLAVKLADGRRLAVKEPQGGGQPSLELEAFMLGELKRLSDLPVPHVHHAEPDLLVMDFIDNDGGGRRVILRRKQSLRTHRPPSSGSTTARSASAPTAMVPLRGYSPKFAPAAPRPAPRRAAAAEPRLSGPR